MSLKPMVIPPVPEETARVARAAFPKAAFSQFSAVAKLLGAKPYRLDECQ